jgi:hypothetical protein
MKIFLSVLIKSTVLLTAPVLAFYGVILAGASFGLVGFALACPLALTAVILTYGYTSALCDLI